MISSDARCELLDFKILEIAHNLSDHNPIYIKLKFDSNTSTPSAVLNKSVVQNHLRWDHADLNLYYEATRQLLMPIYDQLSLLYDKATSLAEDQSLTHGYYSDHCYSTSTPCENSIQRCTCDQCKETFVPLASQIEQQYRNIISSISYAASTTVPVEKTDFFKFWWDQELDELKKRSIDTHRNWLNANRPKHGVIFEEKAKSKAAYRKCIRKNQQVERDTITNDLHDALSSKSQNAFWKMWHSKFGKKKVFPVTINKETNDQVIANKFASYFASVCTVNSDVRNAEFSTKLTDRMASYIGDLPCDIEKIDVKMIDDIVTKLHMGKAMDVDQLSAEHIKFCHPILISILVKLFRLMFICEYIPDAFGSGLTVPIPKHDSVRKLVSTEDFRGITISPIISKVFEFCLVQLLEPYLITSDLQFAFKKKFSCNHAIYAVRSTVDYFTSNGSTVNLCALDLAKAFDKINHHALFLKLMDRNIPLKYIHLLRCWYAKLFTIVKWKDSLSSSV